MRVSESDYSPICRTYSRSIFFTNLNFVLHFNFSSCLTSGAGTTTGISCILQPLHFNLTMEQYSPETTIEMKDACETVAERRADKLGFNATRISSAYFRMSSPLASPLGGSSPRLTIPPGLNPTVLLDSPMMLPNSQVINYYSYLFTLSLQQYARQAAILMIS